MHTTPNHRPYTTRVWVGGHWLSESFATADAALEARDALLDAGFSYVRVLGLPSYFGTAGQYDDDDPADDDELIVLPK
jgi:hypothetical protein